MCIWNVLQASGMSRPRQPGMGGSQVMLSIGLSLATLMMSTVAIDTGWYFAAQNQLQTATDAAALAGGAHMFKGPEAAESAAMEVFQANSIAGMNLSANDLEFDMRAGSFAVKANRTVPTIMARFVCGMSGQLSGTLEGYEQDLPEAAMPSYCSEMNVHAASKVIGTPRDTVLVIDTSSSMDDLGYGQPFKDVKDAAYAFLDMVVDMEDGHPDSVDKIAVVQFDKSAKLVNSFISTQDSGNFNALRSKIHSMRLFSGSGYCTNYEAGLKRALDELEAKSRPGAHRNIIFFTDGSPNLPDGAASITNCLYDYNRRRYSQARNCARTYVNHMISKTNTQIQRAQNMDVTIHTIQISDPSGGNSLAQFRQLLQDPHWEPGLVDAMASHTEGEQFEAASADRAAIMQVFRDAAKIVHIRLAPYTYNE